MANTNIPIIRLKESDIISESMHIINQNFESIANNYDISNFKWEQYSKKIMEEINKLKKSNDRNNINITKTIDDLNERMDNISSENDIQSMVNKAILEAGQDLSGFIKELAGQQIDKALGTYVKSSQLIDRLRGYATQTDLDGYATKSDLGGYVKEDELPNYDLKYVSSTAFDTFKADASKQYASARRIVSNNKLYRTDAGYLVYDSDGDEPEQHIAGGISGYKTVGDVYEAIKDTIDPPNLEGKRKGIDDPDITAALIEFIESTFRVISTELSLFEQKVVDGAATFNIVAAVDPDQNPETGKQVAASIFGYADKDGSKLMLNADQINLSANHKLTLETGTFTINSQNLKLDENGDVSISGDLVAKTLATSNRKTRIDANGILHAQGADIQGSITADKFVAENTKLIRIPYQATETETGYYEGNVTKRTSISGDEFVIDVSGELVDTYDGGHGSNIDVTGNKLYIKIVDKLKNNNDDIVDSSGQKVDYLYGVPVLCMMYNGIEYPLSPASWFKVPVISGENPTNMYFLYVEDTYKSVSANGSSFFFNPKNSYNRLSLSPCKKYKFSYDFGGTTDTDEISYYTTILRNASLINSSNEGIMTYDVSPSGLIRTSQSVGKIPIDSDNVSMFINNLKTPTDIYQKITDNDKMYFGDFRRLPYYIDDVGNTTQDVNTVPSNVSWFNDSIFGFLNDNMSFGTGNWSYEGDFSEYTLSEPQITNPFSTGITGGICGSMECNITGYYRKYYLHGFEDKEDTSAKNGFAECEYLIKIYFIESQYNTISLQRVSGGYDTYYMTDMEVRISFGTYMSSISSPSRLIDEIKNGTISDVGTDVHIDAYIDCSSQPGVMGYNGIGLVYSNN